MPFLKGPVTFSKPPFWVSMLVVGSVNCFIWLKFMVNVAKYTSPMDPMGLLNNPDFMVVVFFSWLSLGTPYRVAGEGQLGAFHCPLPHQCSLCRVAKLRTKKTGEMKRWDFWKVPKLKHVKHCKTLLFLKTKNPAWSWVTTFRFTVLTTRGG